MKKMPKKETKGGRKPKPQKERPSGEARESERPHASRPAAAKKKKTARARQLKTTFATLAAFFCILAALLLFRGYVFPPQGEEPFSDSPQAIASESEASSEPLQEAGYEPKSSCIMEESLAREEPAAAGELPAMLSELSAENASAFLTEEAAPSSADASATTPRPSSVEVPRGEGVLCFVFDDAGHNLFHLEPFLNLPFPCTIAVLPSLAHSADAAEKIRGSGKELILHQPMQAINLSIDPGPGAVKPGMTAEEIRDVVNANLDEIWPVAGLNNHEGSLITGDAPSMEAVLDVVEQRSIFFLDSKTIADTASRGIAHERGMRILERAVFLDNSPDEDAILAEVLKGVRSAARNGFAIMIGHVWSPHLAQILEELYPALTDAGYRIADLSALLASLEEKDARGGRKERAIAKNGERG